MSTPDTTCQILVMVRSEEPVYPTRYAQHDSRPLSWLLLVSGWLSLQVLLAVSSAQVSTTITSDGTLGTTVRHNRNVHTITGGKWPDNGPNLFHSFKHFNVGTGHIARFSSPAGVENILSRVTGEEQSMIDGKLQSPGANLYLLNPNGVLFGPHASLDINGSFHVSTADVLHLADGGTFAAHKGRQSALTVEPPVAFGFLQANPAGITVQESRLQVPAGATISLVSGNIEIIGGRSTLADDPPNISAPSGRIHVTSVVSTGKVPHTPTASSPGLKVGTVERLGIITLIDEALLDVSDHRGGNGGGMVVIRGGRLHIDNASAIRANTGGTNEGAAIGIDIAVTGQVLLTGGAQITTNTTDEGGNAGAIKVQAGQVSLTGGAQITSDTNSEEGRGGAVEITADTVVIAGRGEDGQPSRVSSSTSGPKPAGTVRIGASIVRLEDGGVIQATATSTGSAGTIEVGKKWGQIILTREAKILSSTEFSTPGFTIPGVTGGKGGTIRLVAHSITLSEDASISAESKGTGKAGTIEITAQQGQVTLTRGAQIRSTTSWDEPGGGTGGAIQLTSRTITLSDGATISATSTGTGDAGSIRLTASDTFLSTNSSVTTEATRSQGGTIQVQAHNGVHLRQSKITTTVTHGNERAGNVTIDSQFVVLQASQVHANAGLGPGGNIGITAGVFLTDPASAVTASSRENIDGEIDIRAPVTDLSGVVAPLSQEVRPAEALRHDQCAARLWEGRVSSLVVRERAGMPATPAGVLPGRLYVPPANPGATERPGRQIGDRSAPVDVQSAGTLKCTP